MGERGVFIRKNCLACACLFDARLADHKRGWGKFCDKACAAAYKGGMRPRDVNARCAKYSKWACEMLAIWNAVYDGKRPPEAPSIADQIGHTPRIKKVERPDHWNDSDWGEFDIEVGWDGHKEWTR
jgi:hypothetical protein